MFIKSVRMRAFIGLCVVYAIANPIHLFGGTGSWTNGQNGFSSNIILGGNWTAGVPGGGEIAHFDNTEIVQEHLPLYVVVPNNWIPGQINFSGDSYVMIVNASLSFGNGLPPLPFLGITNTSPSSPIIKVSSNGTILFNGTGGVQCTADAANSGAVYYNLLDRSHVTFDGTSTANNANFSVTGPLSSLTFQGSSIAASATIKTFSGGSVVFSGSANAGLANMTANNGFIVFDPTSAANSGNLANVTLINSSGLDINQNNTLQSLNTDQTSAVNFLIGGHQLTITGNSQTMTIAGPVTGVGCSLVFNNPVPGLSNRTTTFLTAPNTFGGPTIVSGNNSLIGNTMSLANSVVVNSGGSPDATLTFDQDFNGIFNGTISGTAVVANAVTITGGGEVKIPGTIGIPPGSSFVSVPVTIQNGILAGDTNSLRSKIFLSDDNSRLIFRQNANGTFSHDITSTGGILGTVEVDILFPGVTVTVSDLNVINVGLVQLTAGNLTGNGNNLTSDFFLDNNTTLTLSPVTTTFVNDISGPGSLVVANKPSLGVVTVLGVNSYTGGTTIGSNVGVHGNSEALQGDFFLTNALSGVVFDQSIGTNAPVMNGVYSGTISGNGGVIVQGGQKLTFTGPNSYNNGTIVSGVNTNLVGTTTSLQGIIQLLSNANLTFNQSFDGTYLGNLIGTGTLLITGGGRVNMLGTNTFTASGIPITVASGTLEGNTTSIQQSILNNGTVQFTQFTDGTYSQSITGTGNLIKDGPASLTFNSNQTLVNTTIAEGALILTNNPVLGGNVYVKSDGTFVANGTVLGNVVLGGVMTGNSTINGNLSVLKGALFAPGNSIGTCHVGGNYQMAIDSQYAVQVNGAGNNTETFVAGTVVINGGEVDVTSSDGTFLLNHPYAVLHSNTTDGLTGTFSEVNAHGFFNPVVVQAIATYDSQNAYIVLETTIENCAITQNQDNIAIQLDNLINPPADIEALLQVLVTLPCDEINFILDEMSGEQYATEMTIADMTNRRFIRRLYDPLRVLMRTAPCYENYFAENCCRDSIEAGHSMWVEGGASRSSIENGHEGYGVNATGYEVVGGIQHTFDHDWTMGLAVGYFQDDLKFKLPGHAKINTVDVGLYALYRPEAYYVLGDLTFGTTTGNVTRKIIAAPIFVETHGKTHIYQGTFYGEAGFDYVLDGGILGYLVAQPFVGLELGYAHRNQLHENGGGSFDLVIDGKDFFKSSSRLGVHLNTIPDVGQMRLSLDLAWLYRFASSGRTNETSFAAFGTEFDIIGAPEQKSSFEGILNLTIPAGDFISFYLEGAGQVWQSASSWSALGGIQANW